MKKKLIFLILIISISKLYAQTFIVDGLNYNITSGNPAVVEVIGNEGNYSGNIVIPEQVTYNTITFIVDRIGNGSFKYCGGLTSITLPNTITSIGYEAFQNCSGLSSLTLPNSLTSIEEGAFSSCDGLTSCFIPSSVTFIDWFAFTLCTEITSIIVDDNNSSYTSIDGVLFDENITTLIQYPIGKNSLTYYIPSTVNHIGHRSFNGCDSLRTVHIPNSVTNIGHRAFNKCDALTTISCCPSTPPTLYDNNAFVDLWTLLITLNVPEENLTSYQNANIWRNFIIAGVDNCDAIGIDDILQSEIEIFPNPMNDILTISLGDNFETVLNLYNFNGQEILKTEVIGMSQISVNHLPSGIYFYSLISNNHIVTGKLVKD